MSVLLISLTLVLVLFVKYVLSLQAFKAKLKQFKCPPQTFLFGHLSKLNSNLLSTILEYNKKYGNLLHLNATFFAPVLLVSDRVIIKHILSSTTTINKGRLYDAFRTLVEGSLVMAKDDAWRGIKKILTPAFTVQTLEKSIKVFNSVASIFVDKLGRRMDQEIDVTPLIELCTLDATFESLMGVRINTQLNEDHSYAVCMNDMHEVLRHKVYSPWCLVNFIYYFTPTYWRENKLINAISKQTTEVINKRRSEIQRGEEGEGVPFLDVMLKDEVNGGKLTDKQIIYEANAFTFASRDTVVSTLKILMHILCHNPEIQDRIVEELKAILKDDMSRSITLEDTRNMKYLEAVIKETLRMYPSLPFIARKFDEDQNFDGISIPADINVILCIHALHHNEENFPDPHVFNPERFYGNNAASIKPFSYVPFSGGLRGCIGQKHAMAEIKVILTHLLRRYELLPVGNKELEVVLRLSINTKRQVKIKIKPRVY